MIHADQLSAGQLAAVLDQAPEAIYVTAVDNFELLYANKLAKNLLLHKPETDGMTCYQAAGFDAPCPFCQMEKMHQDQFLHREFFDQIRGRMYKLSGKIIDWNGRSAHIEYILDVTTQKQKENQSAALKEQLQTTFSSIPCGLCGYRFDKNGITPLFHNRPFYDIMGYSEEHIRKMDEKTSFLGVHPEDYACLLEKIQEAIQCNGLVQHIYRVFNDKANEYRWIRLDGSVKPQPDGTKLLYGVYSDVSEQVHLEKELARANEKMQDIVNAIPGGVAIYKITDMFETVYFSDGVPDLTGYTVEEYRGLVKRDAVAMTFWEDAPFVISKMQEVIRTHEVADFEFRNLHRDGRIVWVRAQVKWIGEEDGYPLLHCVFHNISALKEAQLELSHLVNSIPGGIASYRVERNCFIPTFFSDGVPALTGHSRKEYAKLVELNAIDTVYEPDRERVAEAAFTALASGEVLDVSFRMRHKNGNLVWLHLNGRRMGPLAEINRFYAVFTGMSEETRLFQNIANETIDGIYVIDKENYDLLYASESRELFLKNRESVGLKCYAAMQGKSAPCEFCTLKSDGADGTEHEMPVIHPGRFYNTRVLETDWNGIPAYVRYVRDVTKEVKTRKEKERLEQYFQTLVKNLPGGVGVIRYEEDGSMTPEFLSDGFAEMTGMTLEDAWDLYRENAMNGVHPDDRKQVLEWMDNYMESGENHCEIIYRLKKGCDSYVWVKNTLSMIQNEGGECRVYAVYHDMTKELEAQDQLRQQYKDMILQHYRMPGPNALIVGHCNITQNRILEIIDHTNSDLLRTFGTEREKFFTGIAGLLPDDRERRTFLNTYLNKPTLDSFARNETEQILNCFIKLPKEARGRYAQFKVNLVETPDTGDITGILTVADVTEQMISERILHKLSVTNYDFIIDLDLERDRYMILTGNSGWDSMPQEGIHSQWVEDMYKTRVVPKDREQYRKSLDSGEIRRRLSEGGSYTFSYSILNKNGDIRTKNMTVSAIDLRLSRVCLVRTDITESVREQQGLLNVIAYTFELMGLVNIQSNSVTLYTRQTVLENLSPFVLDDYDSAVKRFAGRFGDDGEDAEIQSQFCLATILQRLEERPGGYDFVFPYRSESGLRYKQINVLWGDENHKQVCLVRADVTDMLAAERQTKKALEQALSFAEKANQAKSDFLSAMSHDIRTPMNAIMGMTALANAHLGDRERVEDCLHKITISSRHLLSLINDILDMSKIERSKLSLNRMKLSMPELMAQLSTIMAPQARAEGIHLNIRSEKIEHEYFYGDGLRINQIFINLLSNAVKFTPGGGNVDFLVEEILPSGGDQKVCYRFTASDTGIGMSEEFLEHLFEPFSRNDNASQIEGTGLGLGITKGLVEMMGGRISVESQLGKGSVFQIELEFEEALADQVNHLEKDTGTCNDGDKESLFAGLCFLVAEDNAINAEILSELLKMYGARSVVRTDGSQALEEFRAAAPGTYDAILMDIQMPKMNGYEATREIRKMHRDDAGSIPIIAMTANAFAEDVQASKEAGMTAHVAKPIDLEVLQKTLCRILN